MSDREQNLKAGNAAKPQDKKESVKIGIWSTTHLTSRGAAR